VYYYFADHLGTTRTIATASGTVCYDADYTPFGYEMAYTTTCMQNYRFTGLERDSETGNDHTLYRQYEQNLGRWMSPDPLVGGFTNPQSLNRYAYVVNNPTAFTDPSGAYRFYMCDPEQGFCNWGFPGLSGGGAGCVIDGALGPCPTLGYNAYALCPGNVCSGFNPHGQWVQYYAFAGLAAAVNGYYAEWGVGSLGYNVYQAGISASQWGIWYLQQTGSEAGGSLSCGYGICSSTLQAVGPPGEGFVRLDPSFADIPSGTSGAGWWRATNGESPVSDLNLVDIWNMQLGTSLPLFTGTTSGGGRVLLYDPATQGPFECVLVGGPWYWGNAQPCH
jgi:RHS repeat-associated protein